MSLSFPPVNSCTVGIIGLGYVGLPLAIELAIQKKCSNTLTTINRRVIGFDVNHERLSELRCGIDRTNEVSRQELQNASGLLLTSDPDDLTSVDVFIVTVPTPIDKARFHAFKASQTVGMALSAMHKNNPNSTPVVVGKLFIQARPKKYVFQSLNRHQGWYLDFLAGIALKLIRRQGSGPDKHHQSN